MKQMSMPDSSDQDLVTQPVTPPPAALAPVAAEAHRLAFWSMVLSE